MRRIFLIVLDSFGVGESIDASLYNDTGSNTLRAITKSSMYHVENLKNMGLYNIDGVGVGTPISHPIAAYGKMQELSKGKDTTTGHWEMMGIVSEVAMPTFPNGFPEDFIKQFETAIGTKVLCNKPYSGTEVIKDYGLEHMKTGYPIVYTSADSVFQIAAHEDVVPLETLYKYCEIARGLLKDDLAVGRVIARPFVGADGNFTRTPNRHDFSLVPKYNTLNYLKDNNLDVIAVGKISDIFASSGVTRAIRTTGNNDGLNKTKEIQNTDFNGLCFVNLVDFDMLYGHRNDVDGYANAMSYFDNWLTSFIKDMRESDILMITADHGCDPSTPSTDHSREYVPMIVYGKNIKQVNIGIRHGFKDLGKTILDIFDIKNDIDAKSFKNEILKKDIIDYAKEARLNSYSPYSNFKVGAALITKSGKLYKGCNIENSAYSPTCCAERTAFVKAISEGEKEFSSIAIVGGTLDTNSYCLPCGVCRQFMSEFCDKDFKIYVSNNKETKVYTLEELLPHSFELEK